MICSFLPEAVVESFDVVLKAWNPLNKWSSYYPSVFQLTDILMCFVVSKSNTTIAHRYLGGAPFAHAASPCICCRGSWSGGPTASYEQLIIAARNTQHWNNIHPRARGFRSSDEYGAKTNMPALFWLPCSVLVCHSLVKSQVLISRLCLVWQGDSLLKSNLPASLYAARFAHVSFRW